MPVNPQNPQPPFAEPGKQRPESEIEEPGSYRPQRDADPEPDAVDDDEQE
ncbi:MAG TPA: hypothetical protein VGO76_14065 [Luteibacter sp.]|jgi:hypothetical protein|nr:hypothetical protein [Luteibacter sp.]